MTTAFALPEVGAGDNHILAHNDPRAAIHTMTGGCFYAATTDGAAGLQAWIDLAKAENKAVMLPHGALAITSPVYFYDVPVYGWGPGVSTIRYKGGATTAAVHVGDPDGASPLAYGDYAGFTVDANGLADYAVRLYYSYNNLLTRVFAHGGVAASFAVEELCWDVRLLKCTGVTSPYGLWCRKLTGGGAVGTIVIDGGTYGGPGCTIGIVHGDPDEPIGDLGELTLTNQVIIQGSASYGLWAKDGNMIVVDNCHFETNNYGVEDGAHVLIGVGGDGPRNVRITGSSFTWRENFGVDVQGAAHLVYAAQNRFNQTVAYDDLAAFRVANGATLVQEYNDFQNGQTPVLEA